MEDSFSGSIGTTPTFTCSPSPILVEDHDSPATPSSINVQSPTPSLPPPQKKKKKKKKNPSNKGVREPVKKLEPVFS
jgi:hypothetical protein